MKQLNYKRFPITFGIIGACILIYIYTTISYSYDMNAYEGFEVGGYMPLAIYVNHEYMRLISANFIHFGFSHLLMNMISLYNIGPFMESAFGLKRYIILVSSSALGTTLLPYLYYIIFENPYSQSGLTVSGGASGIILGLVGAMCCMSIYYPMIFKNAFKSIFPSLLIVILLSISVPTVSLSGHISGFVSGFITTFILIKHRPFYQWHIKKQDMTNRPC